MTQPIKVGASILCADFSRLADEVKKCENAGIDLLHVDVMDGHFVPNITIGPIIVEALRPLTKLPIDAHLMIENPGAYVEVFIDAGADIISLHAECYGRRTAASREYGQFPKEIAEFDARAARADIEKIKTRGKKVFMVLNPATPLCIEPLLNEIDGVMVMSVNPGFAKQKFIPSVLPKLEQLRACYDGDIAIDGGINQLTAPEAIKAGANIIATASYFFGAEKPKEAVAYLKALSR